MYNMQKYSKYSRKVWQEESFVNLVNHQQFAKLKPSKLVVTIDNLFADLFICQTFSPKSSYNMHTYKFAFDKICLKVDYSFKMSYSLKQLLTSYKPKYLVS